MSIEFHPVLRVIVSSQFTHLEPPENQLVCTNVILEFLANFMGGLKICSQAPGSNDSVL
jgi:hypothetical protein